jgi:hypothetical protein
MLLEKDPLRVEYHRGYINNHFQIAKRTGKYTTREDTTIVKRYQTLASSTDSALRDLGHYGLGLISVLQNDYEEGLGEYGKVVNLNLPYLNNSIGYARLKLSEYDLAEESLRREMTLEVPTDSSRENVRVAVGNLSDLYVKTGEIEKLSQLVSDR